MNGLRTLLASVLLLAPPAGAFAAEGSGAAAVGVEIAGEVFTGFRHTSAGDDVQSSFDLDRAELGAVLVSDVGASAELRLEAVRSAGPRSVMGIDEDSLVLRVKRAAAAWDGEFGPVALHARAGLVADAWIAEIEPRYRIRGLAPLLAERGGFYDTSDLGGAVRIGVLDDRVSLSAQLTNGEGRNLGEQNNGKNLTLVLSGRPLVLDVHRGPLSVALHAAWRNGSVGVGRAADHRVSAGLTFVGSCPSAGFELHLAEGWQGRGDARVRGWGAWATSWLATHWAGVAFRYDALDTSSRSSAGPTLATRMTMALYSDLFDEPRVGSDQRLRVWVAAELDRFGANAAPLPGAADALDATRVLVTVEAHGLWRSHNRTEAP